MDKEITKLKNEKNVLMEKMSKLEKETEEYKLKIKELDIEIERLNILIKELNIKIVNLNKRIKELLAEIEQYKLQIKDLESKAKLKEKKVENNKNTQFCELYKSFTKKTLIRYKIEMIIGMFIKERERHCKVRLMQSEQLNEKLRTKIQSLNEEIEELKRLLNAEDEKIEDNINDEENNIDYRTNKYKCVGRSASQGLVRVIRRSNEPVNVVVKTTKISYRRRNEEGNI